MSKIMKKYNKIFRCIFLISQIGFSIIVSIATSYFISHIIKKFFNLDLTILFLIIGILAGMRSAYILLITEINKQKKEDNEKN